MKMIKSREEHYKSIIYDDLVYYLMLALLVENPNKKEVSGHILDAWETRNKKMVKESLAQQAKKFAEMKDKNDKKLVGEDEAAILLSPQEYVFDSVRKDILNSLKKVLNDCFEVI